MSESSTHSTLPSALVNLVTEIVDQLQARSEWGAPEEATPLEVGQLDQMVQTYKELRAAHEAKKEEASEAFKLRAQAEQTLLQAMLSLGKTKYFVDGIGTVSLVSDSSVTTPKTNEDKEALFGYLEGKFGKDGMIAMLSVHSATLNSFVNKELEANPSLVIPGLSTPTVTTSLRFRKEA